MFQMTIPAADPVVLPFDDSEMNQGFSLLQSSAEFRDGKHRIPTPDKEALLGLSNSFNKHRLKKHQQLLDDITKRCREQEIMDMSDSITKKCKISRFDEKPAPATAYKELTFYQTSNTLALVRQSAEQGSEPTDRIPWQENAGLPRNKQRQQPPNLDLDPEGCYVRKQKKPLFERSNTNFPLRHVKKTQNKGMSPPKSFGLVSQKRLTPTNKTSRERLANEVRINGSIPMELYRHQKYDQLTSSLVLPKINDADRLNEFFMSKRVKLGPKTKSIILSSVSSTGAQLHLNANSRLKDVASTGHVTGRPNSIMEMAGGEAPQTAPVQWTEPKCSNV